MPTRSTESSVREGRMTSLRLAGLTKRVAPLLATADCTSSGWVTTACIYCCRGASGRSDRKGHLVGAECLGFLRLGVHGLEVRDVRIPFEQRRNVSGSLAGSGEERPHLVDDEIAMGVDDVRAVVLVTGQV